MPEYRLTPELERLFSAACDETLTADERAALEAALEGDTELQDTYLAFCRLHADLRQHAQSSRSIQAALSAAIGSDPAPVVKHQPLQPAAESASRSPLTATGDRPVWHEHPFLFGGSAFVLTLALWVVFLWTFLPGWRDGNLADENRIDAAVAFYSGGDNPVWDDTTQLKMLGRGDSKYEGPYYAGDRLHLQSGVIQLNYATGAIVILEGPAEFTVGVNGAEGMEQGAGGSEPHAPSSEPHAPSSNSGFLARGKLAARCGTRDSQGFTVQTPHARVTDLGTEFAVDVQDDGEAHVEVISGEVELVGQSAGGGTGQRLRLKKDQGAFVEAGGGTISRRSKANVQLAAAMRSRLQKIRGVAVADPAANLGPSITIINAGFENASEVAGNGNLATVAGWIEENADMVFVDDNGTGWKPRPDRALYLNAAGAAVNQDLRRSWSSSDTYTLGIIGVEPQWRVSSPGDAFRVQLRETDGTVLWDSGSQSVDGTVKGTQGNVSFAGTTHVFRWTIDASKFAGVTGAVEGTRLNIRIAAENGVPYLDDVSLSVAAPPDPEPASEEAEGRRLREKSEPRINTGENTDEDKSE